MEADRLKKLTDKRWIGPQVEKFWMAHGHDIKSLRKETKLTNLHSYANGNAEPMLSSLAKIAEACKSDLPTLISYIDPGESSTFGGIEVRPEHRHLFIMLSTIIAANNPKRLDWISVSLEEFSAGAQREIDARKERETQEEGDRGPPITVLPKSRKKRGRS